MKSVGLLLLFRQLSRGRWWRDSPRLFLAVCRPRLAVGSLFFRVVAFRSPRRRLSSRRPFVRLAARLRLWSARGFALRLHDWFPCGAISTAALH
uniref:Uncharacterized protein n=1 Tax=Ixodes ricinus TaxID=34613 RepID=A0A6B0UCC1_IXORI